VLDEVEVSAVGLGQAAGQRQAPAVSGLMVTRSVEQRRHPIIGNPDALVLDRDARVLHEDGDGAATVSQRVLEQHVEYLAHETWSGHHVLTDASGHHHLPALLREALLPVGHLMVDQRGEIELGALLGAAGASNGEQFVEGGVEFVRLRQCRRGFRGHLSVVGSLE